MSDKVNATYVRSEFVTYGLFFRNFIQRVFKSCDMYGGGAAYIWAETAKKKVIPYLLNLFRYESIVKHLSNDNCAGIEVNELASPVYFKRNMRSMHCLVHDPDHPVESIFSYGYEPYENVVSGTCKVEYTTIKFKDGREIKLKNTDEYYMTYDHNIAQFLKTQRYDG